MRFILIYLFGFVFTLLFFKIAFPYTEGETGIDEEGNEVELSKGEHNGSDILFAIVWPLALPLAIIYTILYTIKKNNN